MSILSAQVKSAVFLAFTSTPPSAKWGIGRVFFLDHMHPGFLIRLHGEINPNQEQLFDHFGIFVFDASKIRVGNGRE